MIYPFLVPSIALQALACRLSHGGRAQEHRMCDMCVEARQGTSSPCGKLPTFFPSNLVFEHDSVMKGGQHVKNAKSQDVNAQATPASFSLETKW